MVRRIDDRHLPFTPETICSLLRLIERWLPKVLAEPRYDFATADQE
jgi:hypothetical protein